MDFTDIVIVASAATDAVTGRIVIPLIIVLAGVALGKIVKNSILTFAKSVELDKHVKTFLGQRMPAGEMLAGSVAAVIYTIAVVWGLNVAEVLVLALEIVLGFFAVLAVVMFLTWLVSAGPNFASRAWIVKQYGKGAQVTVRGVSGKITSIGPFWVRLRHGTERYSVPNRTFKKDLQQVKGG